MINSTIGIRPLGKGSVSEPWHLSCTHISHTVRANLAVVEHHRVPWNTKMGALPGF